jgi:hypothetical protein
VVVTSTVYASSSLRFDGAGAIVGVGVPDGVLVFGVVVVVGVVVLGVVVVVVVAGVVVVVLVPLVAAELAGAP